MQLVRRYLFSSIIALSIAAFGATALALGVDKIVQRQEATSLPEEASEKAVAAVQKGQNKVAETEDLEVRAEGEGATKTNHGHCVSYWAKTANAEGLKGKERGSFISSIAQNEEAVSLKVAEGGTPDATCDFADELAAAKTAQAAAESEGDRGRPGERGRSASSKGQGKGRP